MSPEEGLKHIRTLVESTDPDKTTPRTLQLTLEAILELLRKGLAQEG